MTQQNRSRPASRDFILYSYWVGLPAGRAVTMNEMMAVVDTDDAQIVRISLTRIRKGIPDPSSAGRRLRPLPVLWNSRDRRYYNMATVNAEAVAAQVPGTILSGAFTQLVTRAATLGTTVGPDGLAAAAMLLEDEDTRLLIQQIPLEQIWQVQDYLLTIGRARQLLGSVGDDPALPPGQRA